MISKNPALRNKSHRSLERGRPRRRWVKDPVPPTLCPFMVKTQTECAWVCWCWCVCVKLEHSGVRTFDNWKAISRRVGPLGLLWKPVSGSLKLPLCCPCSIVFYFNKIVSVISTNNKIIGLGFSEGEILYSHINLSGMFDFVYCTLRLL